MPYLQTDASALAGSSVYPVTVIAIIVWVVPGERAALCDLDKPRRSLHGHTSRAGDRIRTGDVQLGKLTFYP